MKKIEFFFFALVLTSFTTNCQTLHHTYPESSDQNDLSFNLNNDQLEVFITPFSSDSSENILVSNVCHVVSVLIKPTLNSSIMIIPPLYSSPPINDVISGPINTSLGGGGGTTVKSRPIGITGGGSRVMQSNFFISPNPVNEELNFYGLKSKIKSFSIYDFYGQDKSSFGYLNNQYSSITISNLPKGNYILKLNTDENQTMTVQFIKN